MITFPLARPQLAGLPASNVIVQPANRDTGPGILLSLLHLVRRAPAATVAVLPSDHDVRHEAAFRRHLRHAARIVSQLPRRIALLGIPPDRPEPGYGYVLPRRPVARPDVAAAFDVGAFLEKPSAACVARLIAEGALWNSFVMVFRVEWMLELLARIVPAAVARLSPEAEHDVAHVYRSLPPWNFSRDFLARVPEHLVVVRADGIGWSDWGTPEAVARTLAAPGRDTPAVLDGVPTGQATEGAPRRSAAGAQDRWALRS